MDEGVWTSAASSSYKTYDGQTFAVIGDSMSNDAGDWIAPFKTYMNISAAQLPTYAVAGNTCSQVRGQLSSVADGTDNLFVTCGVNGFAASNNPVHWQGIYDDAKAKGVDKIYMTTMPPWEAINTQNNATATTYCTKMKTENQWLIDFGVSHDDVVVSDIWSYFHDTSGTEKTDCGWRKDITYSSDGVHPNVAGGEYWAEQHWENGFNKLKQGTKYIELNLQRFIEDKILYVRAIPSYNSLVGDTYQFASFNITGIVTEEECDDEGYSWYGGVCHASPGTVLSSVSVGLYNQIQTVILSSVGSSSIRYSTTEMPVDCSSGTLYSGAIEVASSQTLYARACNSFGNSQTASFSYTIDTTFPNTTITAHPDSAINVTDAVFVFEADETATFQCKLDSGAYSTCTSPKSYTGLAEGSHTFFVKATDTATNEDPTPAEYTFAVDTQIPTLSDLSPNGTTFPVSTTRASITLNTNETAICRYTTTSGIAYGAMTIFDTTNSTSHSTLVTGLNPGVTYDYSVRCKDAVNESAESHLSFSVAPLESTTPIEKIKIQVNRETNKFKDTLKIASTKFKLKSQDANLANGRVEIYKGGKLWKTVLADASGAWNSTLKLGKNASEKIKVLFYDAFGTLLGDQSAKVKVDSEDPKFTKFITPNYTINKGETLYWEAEDNRGVDHYKVTFNKKNKTVKKARFTIPQNTPNGVYEIKVTAYDGVGNSVTKKTWVRIR